MERLLLWACVGALAACGGPPPANQDEASAPASASPAAVPAPVPGAGDVDEDTGPAGGEADTGSTDDQADTYVGTGNEPGWRVDIGSEQLAISLDYGDRRLAGPVPAVEELADGSRSYQTELDGHAIQVNIQPGPCQDDMSGLFRPDHMQLQVDDRQLRGCAGDPRDLFTGDPWRIVAMDGQEIAEDQHGSLQFDRQDRVTGRAFCNRFSAAYNLTGEGLSIGQAAGTKMACEPVAMALEQRFLALIGTVTRFSLDDADLVLHTADGAILRARR